jgi:antirestriction protein ArdC
MDKLEKGTVPWKKPWATGSEWPKNLVSKKEYRGINTFLLGSQGYINPYWVTFKQCNQLGGKIKKDEKGSMYVFWKKSQYTIENEDGDEETKDGLILRYYNVWNVEQTEGIDESKIPQLNIETREFTPIEECERVISNMPNPPSISNGVAQAYYQPSIDSVNMPAKSLFVGDQEYYSTLFHELTHSTGHEKRLGRHKTCPHHISRIEYSKEELVAEMGAAFLCGHVGIETTMDNSASYIAGWLKALQNDKQMVIFAAAKAQKSTDYILDRSWE